MTQILIIDDSTYQRNKARRALGATGYELLEASNGREGLKVIAINTPDCILLDLIMPEMDGMEVLEVLHEQGTGIPVIVLTADIQESTRQQCLALGTAAFINKPLRGDELVHTIKRILDDKGRVKEVVQWT
jgi:CheY-like chemotaxis protein